MEGECSFYVEIRFRCPSCYFNWHEKETSPDLSGAPYALKKKKCEFCAQPHTSQEILERQMDILDHVLVQDLPEVIRNLYKHVQLKEKD